MLRLITTTILLLPFVDAQKSDPRTVALAGATTTIADGIYAVGYNPALIAYQREKPFMMQVGGFDFGMNNSYISMAKLNFLSGDTLDSAEKTAILNRLENNGGLSFRMTGQAALPAINFAAGNMAITSNLMYFSSYTMPAGMARLILEGNANNPNIDMTFAYEIMAVNETAFSFAIPFDSYALGISVKSLQGLLYMGVDPDSSKADFITTPFAVHGSGRYYIRSGVGGKGWGLDLGIATKELNGMRFGVSLINAIGVIKWNEPSFIKDLLAGKDKKFGNSDDVWNLKWGGKALSDSVAAVYTYNIDSLRADNLSSRTIFSSKSEVVYNLDENGKPKPFNIRYPAIFRMGMSYKKDALLISSDITTGFENRLYANSRWRWAIGAELYRYPVMPLRLGFAWEGMDRTELGMGIGFHGGPVMIDLGFSFKSGMWVHTMKGFNFSLGFTMTDFRGRKAKDSNKSDGPSPVPEGAPDINNPEIENSLPDENKQQNTPDKE